MARQTVPRTVIGHPEPYVWLVASISEPESPRIVRLFRFEHEETWSSECDGPCGLRRGVCEHGKAAIITSESWGCCTTGRCS